MAVSVGFLSLSIRLPRQCPKLGQTGSLGIPHRSSLANYSNDPRHTAPNTDKFVTENNKSQQIIVSIKLHHSTLCLARGSPWEQFHQHLKQLNNTQ